MLRLGGCSRRRCRLGFRFGSLRSLLSPCHILQLAAADVRHLSCGRTQYSLEGCCSSLWCCCKHRCRGWRRRRFGRRRRPLGL